jgi:rod shape-determining protein MreB
MKTPTQKKSTPAAARRAHGSDIAVDLGTAWARAATARDVVRQRKSMTSGRKALAGGVLIDMDAAVKLLRSVLRKAGGTTGARTRVLASAPTDASAVEKAALTECLLRAGSTEVFLVPSPLGAAVGARVDVASPYANMVIDIGEGVTDCAVIHSAQIVASHAVRTGCADLRAAIRNHVRGSHGLELSEQTAERILRAIGVAEGSAGTLAIPGVRNDEPRTVRVPRPELQAALAPTKTAILGAIKALLQRAPGSFAVELIEDGIFLSGGGALLRGMRESVTEALQLEVHVVAEPLRAVIIGARAMLPVAAELRVWQG